METFQFNYFVIHPLLSSEIWQTPILEGYRSFVKFFQVNFLLYGASKGTFLFILYFIFVFNILNLLLMIVLMERVFDPLKKSSTLQTYGVKFLSIYALLITTVLPLSVFNSYLATIICNQTSPYSVFTTCYSIEHIIHLTVAIIGLISFIIIALLYCYLYIDMNPFSTIPFAAP